MLREQNGYEYADISKTGMNKNKESVRSGK
jgi:hypothetical protein